MIYYSLLPKRLCAKTPLRQNASTNLISIFSSIYFGRTHFRGLENIVGFTNSPKSPRNYSPVIKSMDRIAEAKGKPTSICIGGAKGEARGAYYPSIIGYVTENSDILFPVDKSKRLCTKTPLRQNASTHLISIFSIDVFWSDPFQGSWKQCRIYKISKITKKLFTCYEFHRSNSGGVAKAKCNGGKSHVDLYR
jgi:hypothetical protein